MTVLIEPWFISALGTAWRAYHRTDIPIGSTPPPHPKPDDTNTGVPAGVTLTTYPTTGGAFGNISSGVLTVTTPGAVLDGWDFHCRIDVTAANVTVRNSLVRGHAGLATPRGLVNAISSAAVNLIVEYCDLRCDFPNINWQGGVLGHDYTMRFCDVSRTVDGWGAYNNFGVNANVVVYANYIHDQSYYSPDPTHSSDTDTPVSKTHNDGGQLQGGKFHTITWNNIESTCDLTIPSVTGQATGDILRPSSNPNSSGGYNVFYPSTMTSSTLQVNDNVNAVQNVIFEDNWCGQDIKIHSSCPNSSLKRNKFSRGRDGTNVSQIILTGIASTFDWDHTNVYEDDSTPVQVVKNGVVQP